MKKVILSLTVVTALVLAAMGGTFAGFVDTEVSEDNFIQAGMSDLLVNGKNDPDVGAKISMNHAVPCKSIDFWVDVYNWGECSGGDLWIHFKDVLSEEAGTKLHMGAQYVYDGVAPGAAGVPEGYRVASGAEPYGVGVWSTEPEKIAEVGDGWIAQYYIEDDDPNLLGEDYASGIADHLDVEVLAPLVGASGNIMGNPDTNGDGEVDSTEEADWVTNGNRWVSVLQGKLVDIECNKTYVGFLETQLMSFLHIDVHIQQIYAEEWYDGTGVRWDQTGSTAVGVDYDGDGDVDDDDFQKACWPTSALQGDKVTWDMLFELITDP